MVRKLGQSISVVLPAFNEEKNLASTVANALLFLPSYFSDFEIIIVNDGSSDQTEAIGLRLQQENQSIRVIHHAHNLGYGASLRNGFRTAVKDLIFFTDSDGQFCFSDLSKFVVLIETFDMVIGFRQNRRDILFRKLTSRIGNFLAWCMLGISVRDINCAFKIFRRDLLNQIPLSSDGALINTEILTHASQAGWTFKEVPVTHFPRKYGQPTGGNPSVILKTFQEYFQLRSSLQRRITYHRKD